MEKTKLLTQSGTSKNPRKPWHKNCTVLFDHYWHCPYCVSPPTSVQSSSQRLIKYRCRCRKELVCTLEKYHFASIKGRYVLCTVIKIDVCAFPWHLKILSSLKFVLDRGGKDIEYVIMVFLLTVCLLKKEGNTSAALVVRLIILPLLFIHSQGRLNFCATDLRRESWGQFPGVRTPRASGLHSS